MCVMNWKNRTIAEMLQNPIIEIFQEFKYLNRLGIIVGLQQFERNVIGRLWFFHNESVKDGNIPPQQIKCLDGRQQC